MFDLSVPNRLCFTDRSNTDEAMTVVTASKCAHSPGMLTAVLDNSLENSKTDSRGFCGSVLDAKGLQRGWNPKIREFAKKRIHWFIVSSIRLRQQHGLLGLHCCYEGVEGFGGGAGGGRGHDHNSPALAHALHYLLRVSPLQVQHLHAGIRLGDASRYGLHLKGNKQNASAQGVKCSPDIMSFCSHRMSGVPPKPPVTNSQLLRTFRVQHLCEICA